MSIDSDAAAISSDEPGSPEPETGRDRGRRDGLISWIAHRPGGGPPNLPIEGHLASFEGATSWLNSEPLTPDALRGRVVLVDFWTYTCVNWLRTLPWLRAWAAKYEDAGLSIVGVHTPEFGFEKDIENVVAQSRRLGVTYPIAVDNDYAIWSAFANHFWPAVYLADAEGRIRHHHFGEGEDAMTEMAIQQLLSERPASAFDRGLVAVEPRGLELAADRASLRSPETYLGYGQSTGFASADRTRSDVVEQHTATPRLPLNAWGLSGAWRVARHAAIVEEPGGRIAFQFQARDVNLVMGPSSKGVSIPYRVFLDGQIADDAPGTDVGPDGSGIVTDQRTYQLIRQRGPIGERRFEIEFLEAGVEAYCFTFG